MGQALKRRQRIRLVILDIEQLVELRNGEDFVNLRPDVAQLHFTPPGLHFLIQSDELAQGGAGKKLDLLKVNSSCPISWMLSSSRIFRSTNRTRVTSPTSETVKRRYWAIACALVFEIASANDRDSSVGGAWLNR
jgi:hypothetical protein